MLVLGWLSCAQPDSLWNDSYPLAIEQSSEDKCIGCSIQFRQRKENHRLKTLHPSLYMNSLVIKQFKMCV